MNVIKQLLEEFYFRFEPLGVAFVEGDSVLFGAGRPCEFVLQSLPRTEGLSEEDYPWRGALVFVFTLPHERHLVVQYPTPSEVAIGPPSSFVRFSSAVIRALENPGERPPPPPPAKEVPVPRPPRKPTLGPLRAEAEDERGGSEDS